MASSNPAELFQDLVWGLVWDKTAPREERWLWEQLRRAQGDNPDHLLGRYILATGLLTYGHLEMADVILDNLPALPNQGRGGKALYLGTNAVKALLPIPAELRGESDWYARIDAHKMKHWLQQHRDTLQWDTKAGRFVLGIR